MIARRNGIALLCITLGFMFLLTVCSKLPKSPLRQQDGQARTHSAFRDRRGREVRRTR